MLKRLSGLTAKQHYMVQRWGGGVETNTEKNTSPFVTVINEGSERFDSLGLAGVSERLDFRDLCRKVLESAPEADKARGNLQLNFLFSGGENQRREETELEHHFGCAMPYLNNGSGDYVYVAVELSRLARKMMVPWTMEGNVQCPTFQLRNQLFSKRLDEENVFEGITVALLELYPGKGRVKEHTDKLNCPVYTETLLFGEIINMGGTIYRVVVIAYMRKSCHDTMIRRAACEEVSFNCTSYLERLPVSLLPRSTPQEHAEFYKDLGQFGVGLIVEKVSHEKFRVHSAALLSRPHMDKPMAYISPLVNCIATIYKKNLHLTISDVIEMCIPMGQLNGIFTLGTVLQKLSEQDTVEPDQKYGILGTIVKEINALTGSYSGGSFPRCQVSFNEKELRVERIKEDTEFLARMCDASSEIPSADTSYSAHCRQKFYEYSAQIKKQVLSVGDLGAQHLIYALAQLGILKPEGLVHRAAFGVKNCVLKRKGIEGSPNRCMLRYLDGKTSNRMDRGRRIMESVIPHLERKHSMLITDSILEQVNCESYRGKVVCDFYYPSTQNTFMLPNTASPECSMQVMKPFIDGKGKVHVKSNRRQLLQPRSIKAMDMRSNSGTKIPCTQPTTTKESFRLPREYIEEFDGLWEQTQRHFMDSFDPVTGVMEKASMGRCTSWIQSHPILSELIKHFVRKHNRPALHTSINTPDFAKKGWISKTPTELKYEIGQAKVNNFIANHPPLVEQEEEEWKNESSDLPCIEQEGQEWNHQCNERIVEDEVGISKDWDNADGKPETLPILPLIGRINSTNTITGIKETPGTMKQDGAVLASVLVKGKNRKRGIEDIPVEESLLEPLPIESAEVIPALQMQDLGHEGDGIPIKKCNFFSVYQFSNQNMCQQIVQSSFGGLSTMRQLTNHKAGVLLLSPINSEAKRALFCGVSEGDMPVNIKNELILNVACTEEEYNWTKTESLQKVLHMTQWLSCPDLCFNTTGVCVMVDKIARYLGAVRASHKKTPGLNKWLFPQPTLARRFLFQCLLILGGKPAYFRRLMKRVCKTAKPLLLEKTRNAVVVSLNVPKNNIGPSETIFYAVVKGKKTEEGKDVGVEWKIALAPGSEEENPGYLACKQAFFIDPSTWKEKRLMTNFQSHDMSWAFPRRKRRRKKSEETGLPSFPNSQPNFILSGHYSTSNNFEAESRVI